jgi:hypothetical protein
MVEDSYVAIRCQAVVVARKMSTVWRTVATGDGGRFLCSHRCQAVVVARKMSTVWRTVATIAVGSGEENVHRLATGGYDRGGSGEEDVHRLANGGYDCSW